ncbi:MAG TPA: hypothetical protein VLL94_01975, partial [Nitrospiraceae bacterium]|nr:hypothetical protein [Nitrospiraceae bacterium]
IFVSGWLPTLANGAGSSREKTETSRPYEVTGTLSALDLASGRGMIRTDLGQPIYLEVKQLDLFPSLFPSLSVGDRVTIQLNGDGQVDKIMGASVPELAVTGQPIPETLINK